MKLVNRIAEYLGEGQRGLEPQWTSFSVNPFPMAIQPWQVQLYHAAFAQAQREVQAALDEWVIDDWCI